MNQKKCKRIRKWLRKHGIDPTEGEMMYLRLPDRLMQLITGQVISIPTFVGHSAGGRYVYKGMKKLVRNCPDVAEYLGHE